MASGEVVVFGNKKELPGSGMEGRDPATDDTSRDTTPTPDTGRSQQPAGDDTARADDLTTMDRDTAYRQAANERRRKRLARVMGARSTGRS
jgi:hypothetical protein